MITVDDTTAALLDALLPQIPFDGWTEKSLRLALSSIGQPPEDAVLYFPGGAGEMIEAFFSLAAARAGAVCQAGDFAALRTPARVRAIIAAWLAQNRGNKEAVRRALSWLTLPNHMRLGARITAATVDTFWHAAGDASADFSWYTKRGILGTIFSATLLYWLSDTSAEDENTLAFLDRRLANVAQLTAARKRFEARFAH